MASPTSQTTDPKLIAQDCTDAKASQASPANNSTPKRESQSQSQSQSSPKRKSSEANNHQAGENGEGKKKRRKVNHACVYCRRSHMTCDLERPCARCVKRDIGHLCHDEPREPPKRSKSEASVADIAPVPNDGIPGTNGQMHGPPSHGMPQVNGTAQPHLVQPTPLSPTTLQRPVPRRGNTADNFLQSFDWNNSGTQSQFQDMHHLHPNYMFNTSEVTNEYNLLNDFLSSSLIDDGGIYNDSENQQIFNDPLLTTMTVNALANSTLNQPNSQQPQSSTSTNNLQTSQNAQAGQEISRPSSTFPIDSRARDKFYMTAADPAGLSSAEDRLHKLLKAKYDAGMLKPFNYVRGYARLNQYMSKHLTRESQLRILKQLDRFRPKFREAMQSLTDMQLVLVEMWFERSLMEYDRVFASMAIPACCWRRTGEIFRGNMEMAELIRVPPDRLRDGKMAIHEIIAEDSLVSYWEKFGAIAFDQSQKAILTSCALKRPSGKEEKDEKKGNAKDGEGKEVKRVMETIRCCFSFTIRRDTHNIPSLIVGNFLPITPRQQSTGSQ